MFRILPRKSTIRCFSPHQMKQYRHNTFESFILGNAELIDFVFGLMKWQRLHCFIFLGDGL